MKLTEEHIKFIVEQSARKVSAAAIAAAIGCSDRQVVRVRTRLGANVSPKPAPMPADQVADFERLIANEDISIYDAAGQTGLIKRNMYRKYSHDEKRRFSRVEAGQRSQAIQDLKKLEKRLENQGILVATSSSDS